MEAVQDRLYCADLGLYIQAGLSVTVEGAGLLCFPPHITQRHTRTQAHAHTHAHARTHTHTRTQGESERERERWDRDGGTEIKPEAKRENI